MSDQKPYFTITIHADGQMISSDAHGFKGKGCEKLAEILSRSKSMKIVEVEQKAEYHQRPDREEPNVEKEFA